MLAPHFTWGFLLHLSVSQASRKTGGWICIAGMLLLVLRFIYTHSGRVKAPLTLNGKWQIWIMHTYNPTNINTRHGGLTGAKSRGCWRPESADYTPEALNNAPKCASLKAWNPWSIRADMSFAINIPSCLCLGGQHCTVLMCPNTNTGKALKEPPSWVAIFLAQEYSRRRCHNKGNNKRGHVVAPHGVSITINRRKAMS